MVWIRISWAGMPTLRCRGEKRATVWVLVHRSSGHRPSGHRSVPLQRDAGLGPLRRRVRDTADVVRLRRSSAAPVEGAAVRLRGGRSFQARERALRVRLRRPAVQLPRLSLWGRAATAPSVPRGRARSKSKKIVPSVSDLAIVAPPVANVKRSGAQISGKG